MTVPSPKNGPSQGGPAKQILLADDKSRAARFEAEQSTLWLILAALGLTLAVIGWTDLALLWYPLNFGDAEWEFGTISAHYDGLPLGTIGLATSAVAVMALGWRLATRVLSGLFALITLGLVGIFAIYLLDVPVALGGVAPAIVPIIKKAIAKAVVFATVYMAFYGWLSVHLWRKTRLVTLPAPVD